MRLGFSDDSFHRFVAVQVVFVGSTYAPPSG
jgi:hypothetical protein